VDGRCQSVVLPSTKCHLPTLNPSCPKTQPTRESVRIRAVAVQRYRPFQELSSRYIRSMKVAPWHLVVAMLAGWIHSEQLKIINYLKEENKVLREQLGGGRIWFTDDQRRRLAAKGRELGSNALQDLGCIVTRDTILRWYRRLIACKYDGSQKRGPGRPGKAGEVRNLVVRMAEENPRCNGQSRTRDR
jgi:hypothetical protein